ncbi:Elongation factor 4 [Frankliniella fusca]|uniref:Elongation factor 4 n=1 Tax=Frankliniella fusca TaxID=407009 RepID=A0AAE1LRA2_9NEOP|nr:Elongation factor 4 [Frankliniella fusca]
MSHYSEYFIRQAQTGQGMGYFSGIPNQRGHGVGQFLGGLFRTVLPFLGGPVGSVIKTVGREALKAVPGIFSDIGQGNDPVESVKRHAATAGHHLIDRMMNNGNMSGNGIKRASKRRATQSGRVTRRANTRSSNNAIKSRATAQRFIHDIFSR